MTFLGGTVDTMTGARNSIDYAHHEVHEGNSFECCVVDRTMADTNTISLAFKTPAGTKRAHMVIQFETLVGCHVVIIEGPTWTQGTGVATTIFNKKREAAMASSMLLEDRNQVDFTESDQLIANVTGVSGGTDLPALYRFGAAGGKTGLGGRGATEWIMAPDTQYVILFTADGASNAGLLVLDWYEHTDAV